jgi:hypothetical protein
MECVKQVALNLKEACETLFLTLTEAALPPRAKTHVSRAENSWL